MPSEVIAELEIDGNRVLHFTDIYLTQRFNEHHKFSIQVDLDVFETFNSFSVDHSKDLIGKSAVIRFLENAVTRQVAYEFTGIISEIEMIHSHSSVGELLIKGYSPTILLEDGPRLASFSDKNLNDVVSQVIQPGWSKTNQPQHIDPNFTNTVKYLCQYKESSFHFINRLSSDYGELFYYDGSTLVFGSPQTMEVVDVVYGGDMDSMYLSLHVAPIESWRYAYASRTHEFAISRGAELSGLDNYASHVVQVSNDLYSDLDDLPIMPRVETPSELEFYVNKTKEAKAAELVVLHGTTDNPKVKIGSVANIQVSRRNDISFSREDFGAYLITGVTHHVTGNGRYYNSFEALSSWVKGVPVYNIKMPLAEPQMGWIVDNHDPDNLSRVRVQLLWQKDDEKTDWIWVMTPDAGNGKDGAPGSGMVFIPEIGDRVIIGFVYNNPDRPFVMGSMFHGKSARAPNPKCLSGRSGAKVCIDDAAGSVTIEDKSHNKIFIDGNNKIDLVAAEVITLTCGSSSIELKKDGTITISGKVVNVNGSDISLNANQELKMEGTGKGASLKGLKIAVESNTSMEIKGVNTTVEGSAQVELKGGAVASVSAAIVKVN